MRAIFLLPPLKQMSVETTKGTNDSRPKGNLETNQSTNHSRVGTNLQTLNEMKFSWTLN